MPPPVKIINEETDDEPDEESNPVGDGQPGHQEQTGENGDDGSERSTRRTKGAGTVRIAVAQDEHASSDQREGEQRADVRKIGESANVEKAGGNADKKSGDPGGE